MTIHLRFSRGKCILEVQQHESVKNETGKSRPDMYFWKTVKDLKYPLMIFFQAKGNQTQTHNVHDFNKIRFNF